MKYLKFDNGDQIPALGLGTWKSKPGEVYDAVRKAISLGYKHFDCAFVYGNEKEIGAAFADAFKTGEVTREELFITSKLWNNRHRSEQIQPAIEETLSDLGLEYLDLYLIHWPVVVADHTNFPQDASDLVSLKTTPLEETWEGMVRLKDKALARHIGVSNFSPAKITLVTQATGVKPEVDQVESHPFHQQQVLKDYCDSHGIILTAYSPLGSSDRPANRIAENEPKLFENSVIREIAEGKGRSAAQIMLAWAVNRGTVVIPKSVNADRLKQNLEAADIELSEEEMEKIKAVNENYRFIKGDFWCLPGSDYTFESLWG